eukprot:11202516-Lingulodinium_polyedra.AAC.1
MARVCFVGEAVRQTRACPAFFGRVPQRPIVCLGPCPRRFCRSRRRGRLQGTRFYRGVIPWFGRGLRLWFVVCGCGAWCDLWL